MIYRLHNTKQMARILTVDNAVVIGDVVLKKMPANIIVYCAVTMIPLPSARTAMRKTVLSFMQIRAFLVLSAIMSVSVTWLCFMAAKSLITH